MLEISLDRIEPDRGRWNPLTKVPATSGLGRPYSRPGLPPSSFLVTLLIQER
jgi:hypothetical protein